MEFDTLYEYYAESGGDKNKCIAEASVPVPKSTSGGDR